ncbi:hypothetical protein Acj9p030 [Acinetobacter phage Acj9]|uniref:Uncharacterized protein n=1 Tax=Acinetobacter phage Acj9 TaxID=760939 RepID=E5EPG4_9CAUD|nr:hypothetical protein Acj9p030 [Acinetobacter phage Acj9]ADG59930.1 hypothetical protein Acj9p030 [Acinetobacter phage Acj9]
MSITLNQDQVDFIGNILLDARSLLDNVHCYETEEYERLGIAINVLSGQSVEEATANCSNEEE